MKKSKWPQKAHLWLSPLSLLAHLIVIAPFNVQNGDIFYLVSPLLEINFQNSFYFFSTIVSYKLFKANVNQLNLLIFVKFEKHSYWYYWQLSKLRDAKFN
jgi:hypothetical protein